MPVFFRRPKAVASFLVLGAWLAVLMACSGPSHGIARDHPKGHPSTFGSGDGPADVKGAIRLLDENGSPAQSNAVAFDRTLEGAFDRMFLACDLRVPPGTGGGAFLFLSTAEYGPRGPAPFVKSWAEPNLTGTFAVGIGVHDPPNDEGSRPGWNDQGRPEREVSLHWDGREIVRRAAPAEFRGGYVPCEILVRYVVGGAEVSVLLAGKAVYDRYFLPGMTPYEARVAIGAGTGDDATTEFDVRHLDFELSEPAATRRRPTHVPVFNHVRTGYSETSPRKEVDLPLSGWAYGRVILNLDIHDAGESWDEWDRYGHVYVTGPDGGKHDILPLVTSFRKPCRWQVDVTHFRPWLAGRVEFEVAVDTTRDGERGFMASAGLDFYHGKPDLLPFRVVPVWNGTARYGSAENHFRDFFSPRSVGIDPDAEAARLFLATSGHAPVGEFTPSRRTVIFDPVKNDGPGDEVRFENLLWKDDNDLNPCRPQAGTWKYARAGWGPGDVIRPWEIDLTPYVIPGETAELRYEPEPYDFSSVPDDERPSAEEINRAFQVVQSYLVLYRSPDDLLPVPPLRILRVLDDSNAARSGLREGDYIQAYEGRRPDSIAQLREFIQEAENEGRERVHVEMYRGMKRMTLDLEPGRIGVLLVEE